MRAFSSRCGRCGRDHRVLQPCGGHKQVVFRSACGVHLSGLVDALDDELFARVGRAVPIHPVGSSASAQRTGRATRQVLARLSDPAPDGSRFDADAAAAPACPHSGATSPSTWSSVEPPELAEVDVAALTGTAWDARPSHEQEQVLADEVGDALS